MNTGNVSFPSGMPVYDAGGEKLGTVSDRQDKDGFLVVHKGRFLGHDALVPRAAIDHEDGNGVYLRVRKDDLKSMNQTPLPEPTAPTDSITGAPTAFAADPLPVPVVIGVPEPELGLATPVPSAASADATPASGAPASLTAASRPASGARVGSPQLQPAQTRAERALAVRPRAYDEKTRCDRMSAQSCRADRTRQSPRSRDPQA